MKKTIFIVASLFILSACGQPKVNMDQPAADGKYHYENQDLKFSVVLPAEFIYYQTQRLDASSYSDIEFFVPTNDPDYIDETVPSYAKPLVVRAYTKSAWEGLGTSTPVDFAEIDSNEARVYALKFWDRRPKDWTDKWNEDLKKGIEESFDLR